MVNPPKTHFPIPKSNPNLDTLGISPNSERDDIKKAFNTLVKKYHPDRNPENSKLFTEIVFSNPKKNSQ
jgi:DnaJ-class molecular chaperone